MILQALNRKLILDSRTLTLNYFRRKKTKYKINNKQKPRKRHDLTEQNIKSIKKTKGLERE